MLHAGCFGRRAVVISFMISGLVLGGCQMSTAPQDVDHFSTRAAPTQEPAAYSGMYDLFGDDTDQQSGPLLHSVRLKQGEVVGFEVGADNQAYAVAANQRFALKAGHYRWQMTPDPGQTDWHRTNVLVVEVLVGTAVVALIVVSTVLAVKKF